MASTVEAQQKSNKEEEAYSLAMELTMGIALPMTMQATIELGLLDIIAEQGESAKLSATEIAAKLPTTNPDAPKMLDRILGLLVSYCVLGCSVHGGERLYNLAPVGKYFVDNQDGVSLYPYMALVLDKVLFQSWSRIKDAILEGGIAFKKVHGMNFFEYNRSDPRFSEVFNKAMFNHSTLVMKKILDSYSGFEQLKQLVDVGGGLGVTLDIITSKYPHVKGVNFDLPHVIQDAPLYPGVEHVGGDMFEKVPKGDSILMKWILHNWDDDQCVKLLKNCYESIPEDGKVIVIDGVLPEMAEATPAEKDAFLMDIIMSLQLPRGKERTKQQFMALATESGFIGINFACRVCNLLVMEFFK